MPGVGHPGERPGREKSGHVSQTHPDRQRPNRPRTPTHRRLTCFETLHPHQLSPGARCVSCSGEAVPVTGSCSLCDASSQALTFSGPLECSIRCRLTRRLPPTEPPAPGFILTVSPTCRTRTGYSVSRPIGRAYLGEYETIRRLCVPGLVSWHKLSSFGLGRPTISSPYRGRLQGSRAKARV